jgi:NAD(P)-dependent dehydrogenase (short-subunit alcohol dehydrogenase family)
MSRSVAVVTGASQGIGRATAIRLARDFSALVLVARNRPHLEETAEQVGGGLLKVAKPSTTDFEMEYIKAFIAGFVSTLTFHQGLLAILHAAGISPRAPWAMDSTGPLHVPAVISLAFWGGLWGIALWLVIQERTGPAFWFTALVLGAIAPSIIALGIVFPLKGMPFASDWDPKIIIGALMLNGAWGVGVALLMRLTSKL